MATLHRIRRWWMLRHHRHKSQLALSWFRGQPRIRSRQAGWRCLGDWLQRFLHPWSCCKPDKTSQDCPRSSHVAQGDNYLQIRHGESDHRRCWSRPNGCSAQCLTAAAARPCTNAEGWNIHYAGPIRGSGCSSDPRSRRTGPALPLKVWGGIGTHNPVRVQSFSRA